MVAQGAKATLTKIASHSDCLAKHDEIQRKVGNVAKAINANKITGAESMLSACSSYTVASNTVPVAVRRLKNEACL
jgi:translation elongation factor EF-Ts